VWMGAMGWVRGGVEPLTQQLNGGTFPPQPIAIWD
jgi:hypothetical protein